MYFCYVYCKNFDVGLYTWRLLGLYMWRLLGLYTWRLLKAILSTYGQFVHWLTCSRPVNGPCHVWPTLVLVAKCEVSTSMSLQRISWLQSHISLYFTEILLACFWFLVVVLVGVWALSSSWPLQNSLRYVLYGFVKLSKCTRRFTILDCIDPEDGGRNFLRNVSN
jgi:hypothetical protein